MRIPAAGWRRETLPGIECPCRQGEAEGGRGPGDSQVSVLGLAPGTPFMARVEEALCYWVCQRLMMPSYRHLNFEVSGANVPVRRGLQGLGFRGASDCSWRCDFAQAFRAGGSSRTSEDQMMLHFCTPLLYAEQCEFWSEQLRST